MAPATGRIAVIGETSRVLGFGLAGARALAADDDAAVLAAWRALPADVAVVVLTPRAARALGKAADANRPLTVVLP
jgi:vacuolar-type H+-ATPase subunit F/Vma7